MQDPQTAIKVYQELIDEGVINGGYYLNDAVGQHIKPVHQQLDQNVSRSDDLTFLNTLLDSLSGA